MLLPRSGGWSDGRDQVGGHGDAAVLWVLAVASRCF